MTVMHADRLATMGSIKSGAAGLVIIDPPECPDEVNYGGGIDPVNIVERWSTYHMPTIRAARRLLMNGGAIVVMGPPLSLSGFDHAIGIYGDSFRLTAEFVVLWRGSSTRESRRLVTPVEAFHTNVRWYVKGGLHPSAPLGEVVVPSNVVVCKQVPVSLRAAPCQRPIELFTYFISLLAPSGALVVDPYCGTGSALVAASIADRLWVGGDRDPAMVKIAKNRVVTLDIEQSNTHLFQIWTPAGLKEISA